MIPAASNASYATSSSIRCCGSMALASMLVTPKNKLSNNAGSCLIKWNPLALNYSHPVSGKGGGGGSFHGRARLTEAFKSDCGCQNEFIWKRLLPLLDHPVRPLASICQRPSGFVAIPERRQDIPTTAIGMRPSPSVPLAWEEGRPDIVGSSCQVFCQSLVCPNESACASAGADAYYTICQ